MAEAKMGRSMKKFKELLLRQYRALYLVLSVCACGYLSLRQGHMPETVSWAQRSDSEPCWCPRAQHSCPQQMPNTADIRHKDIPLYQWKDKVQSVI